MAPGTEGRTGSLSPMRPRNSNAMSRGDSGKVAPVKRASATPSARRPSAVSFARWAWRASLLRRVEMAELDDRLGRALADHDVFAVCVAVAPPDAGQRQQVGPQRIFADEGQACGVVRRQLGGGVVDGALHGVKRRFRAGEGAGARDGGDPGGGGWRGPGCLPPDVVREDLLNGHAVDGERARLVHAERGGRAERLEGGHAAGEGVALGDAPGAEREEDSQDDRKLFGDNGHRQRQSGQRAAEPVVAQDAIADRDDQAEGDGDESR